MISLLIGLFVGFIVGIFTMILLNILRVSNDEMDEVNTSLTDRRKK